MLHACAARFDVTGNLGKFWKLNNALVLKKFCKIFNYYIKFYDIRVLSIDKKIINYTVYL